jgi:hypothetical protein
VKIEELIQGNTARGESGAHDTQVNQKQTTDLPMALNDEHQKEKIEVKKESNDKLGDGIPKYESQLLS